MLKLHKYKIFFAFLLVYLLLTEAFSSFNKEGNEDFIMFDDFYSGPLTLLSPEFDFSNPCKINTDSNNIINNFNAPIDPQIISDNQSLESNFTWQVSEHDIYNEDYFMDFTPPVSSEITNNASPFISVQSKTKDITSKKSDPVKKVIPEKKNTNKKRKISIEEISEFEEEKIDEKQNQNLVKKIRKRITWTPEMENHLKKLKSEINPVTNKKYTSQKIAEIMTKVFSPLEFTTLSVQSKWNDIGEDQILKFTNWNTEMDNLLRKLKITGNHTYEEIVKIMKENFPSVRFPEWIVRERYQTNLASVKKTRKGVRWTPELEEHLKNRKNKINPVTNKKYTHEDIARIMTKKFSPLIFTTHSVEKKWRKIGEDQILKFTNWNTEMDNLLRELKITGNHTYERIADIMKKNFSSARFTKASVMGRWTIIKKRKDEEK